MCVGTRVGLAVLGVTMGGLEDVQVRMSDEGLWEWRRYCQVDTDGIDNTTSSLKPSNSSHMKYQQQRDPWHQDKSGNLQVLLSDAVPKLKRASGAAAEDQLTEHFRQV